MLLTPVVIVPVIVVLAGSKAVGAKIAILLVASKVTVPAMGVTPGPVSLKVAVVMVVGSIA